MNPLRRLAFIGNSLPRRCGIATFTSDLQQDIAAARKDIETMPTPQRLHLPRMVRPHRRPGDVKVPDMSAPELAQRNSRHER